MKEDDMESLASSFHNLRTSFMRCEQEDSLTSPAHLVELQV